MLCCTPEQGNCRTSQPSNTGCAPRDPVLSCWLPGPATCHFWLGGREEITVWGLGPPECHFHVHDLTASPWAKCRAESSPPQWQEGVQVPGLCPSWKWTNTPRDSGVSTPWTFRQSTSRNTPKGHTAVSARTAVGTGTQAFGPGGCRAPPMSRERVGLWLQVGDFLPKTGLKKSGWYSVNSGDSKKKKKLSGQKGKGTGCPEAGPGGRNPGVKSCWEGEPAGQVRGHG